MEVTVYVDGSTTTYTGVTEVQPIVNGTKLLLKGTTEHIVNARDLVEIVPTV